MIYCDKCAKEKELPLVMSQSYTICEFCGGKHMCNVVTSKSSELVDKN